MKGINWHLKRAFLSENTVKSVRFNGKSLPTDEMNGLLASSLIMVVLFLFILFCGTLVTIFFSGDGTSTTNALFESASAMATCGLTTGIVGPFMSPVLEVVYIFQMLAGRLEIIPVLALIRAVFWGTQSW